MASRLKEFTKGIFEENPTFGLMLGLCPTLATSTSLKNGVGMGLAAGAVLVCSNIVVSLIRKVTPEKIRIPMFIVAIATFVTIVDMSMEAWTPELHKSLGIFIPLIVVNCIILGRAEAFAQKNGVVDSALDALGMTVGFTGALALIGTIREVIGLGTVWGVPVTALPGLGAALSAFSFLELKPALIMILPPGGFILMGLLLGYAQLRRLRKEARP